MIVLTESVSHLCNTAQESFGRLDDGSPFDKPEEATRAAQRPIRRNRYWTPPRERHLDWLYIRQMEMG